MGFGVVSLLNAVFRRAFTSAGLRPSSVAVDADTTLHFWAHPSLLSSPDAESKQRGRRPVVVLIHGFGPDPTWQWASQVGPLSKHFDLIVPTLLFFGASTTRAPGRSDAFQAAAIAKLLASDHLAAGDGRVVHVVGTSYGGLVAYHLARALQQGGGAWTVGKVAVCSSDLAKGPEDDRALAAKGGVADVTELMVPADTKALRRLMDICAHGPPKYLPECLARDLLRKCFAVQREGKIELIKGIASGHGFQITPLPQEVLIVWGEFDQIFPVAKAHKVKEKLGEKATVRIIPNTGHLPQQEDSKLFNQILLDFLLPPPSSSNGAVAAAK
ncbi:hypothetical protein CFC21_040025 [Triticum aestivum]|uniref:AB hydrolase-1 domain-containing protein n=2 Tax=Triticum aestivum TaxID=4565 RepID=A0A9R1FFX4_WHEAT|nr:dihydrolipoyllysine-residue acetyltransferase component of acetoin cleaving system-like isoform X1 [Triticum aestivum]KAF7028048.1 hypothetical protein CFC21_040025 [Triticum aestivum]CDM81496.1 unnamed protein product [Triticum aestivum]